MVDPRIITEILNYFRTEIVDQSFRHKINVVSQQLGMAFYDKPPVINSYLARLTEDLAQITTTGREEQRLLLLKAAFSQVQDAMRTSIPRELLAGALASFYRLSNLPELGNTASFTNKELRSLALLGLAASYYELKESDILIAEKLAHAIYESPPIAAQFLDIEHFQHLKNSLGLFTEGVRFTIQDGIAIDAKHHLIWLRFALGQRWSDDGVQGRLARYAWQETFAAAALFNKQGGYEGYTDWRLPTIEELKTLIDQKAGDAKQGIQFIDSTVFPQNYDLMWSSSRSSYKSSVAWLVDFTNGSAFYGHIKYGYGVRLVRDNLFFAS